MDNQDFFSAISASMESNGVDANILIASNGADNFDKTVVDDFASTFDEEKGTAAEKRAAAADKRAAKKKSWNKSLPLPVGKLGLR